MNLRNTLLPVLCLAALLPATATAQTISTVAGNGGPGNTGDGGSATAAEVGAPLGVQARADGGFYVAGFGIVRRVAADGSIHPVAGDGSFASSGDGGPAIAAKVGTVGGLALGPDGLLYIGDVVAGSVRRVDAGGNISTIVTGVSPDALAFDRQGNLYIGGACKAFKWSAGVLTTIAGSFGSCGSAGGGGDGGPATAAGFVNITGIAADAAGNVWVADGHGHALRRIGTDGVIATVPSMAYFPRRMAADAAGNVYVTDVAYSRVSRIAPDGSETVVAGDSNQGFSGDGGPAVQARLYMPTGVSVAHGAVLIADTNNNRVRKVTADAAPLGFLPPQPDITCASEGYTGTKLTWCQNICEKGYTGATLDTWIHRWTGKYRDLPYCAVEAQPK